jgi:heme/copper-type cytochrome/quinol oxidase subunit 4
MAAAVYILGIIVTLSCGMLLIRAYGRVGKRLLLWSGICFLGLALSNLLLFLDMVVFPNVDLYLWRLLTAALAMMVLVYGLIWERDA